MLDLHCHVWASLCSGFSCCGAQARVGPVVVACGLSCSIACGIFLDQGSNLCPLIDRQILMHCTTRDVCDILLLG